MANPHGLGISQHGGCGPREHPKNESSGPHTHSFRMRRLNEPQIKSWKKTSRMFQKAELQFAMHWQLFFFN